MKLLGLEIPEWTGPTLCETSGGDLDILPFGAWKKEVKIELKIEENKDAIPKTRKKRKADSEGNVGKDVKVEKEVKKEDKETNKHKEDVFSDSQAIKTQNVRSLNGSSHNSHCSSDVNSTVTESSDENKNTDGCSS